MTITVHYDDNTRELGAPMTDGYVGTTLDRTGTRITVTGIPDGFSARLDFDVAVSIAGKKKKASPYLTLDATGSCIIPNGIMAACKEDLRLPAQLVLDSPTTRYASKNWLIFQVSPSIGALETIVETYGPDIMRSFVDVNETAGTITFTRLDGTTATVHVDDDFIAWTDVDSSLPAVTSHHKVPSTKLVDDTYLKSTLPGSERILMTDIDGKVSANGPRLVTLWSPSPSHDNVPTEELVYDSLISKADDADVVHNDRGTPVWRPNITYSTGSTVIRNLNFYISQNPENTNHPPDEEGTVWWAKITGSGGGGEPQQPGAYKVFTIGDGTNATFVCNHGFNSKMVAHVLYANATANDEIADFTREDVDRIRVTFNTAPTSGAYTLVVYRPGLGPESVVTTINGQQGDIVITPEMFSAVAYTSQTLTEAQKEIARTNIGAAPIARTVNGHALSSDVVVDKADVGLSNADNTSDADKPISNATQTALGSKVDKNPSITAGTSPKVSYDAKGLITAGHSLAAADIPDISATYVTVSGTGRANRNVITGSDGNIVYAVPPVLGTAAALNVGTESGNVPVLNASGKLADSVVPPLAIGDYIGEVTTKAGLTGFTSAQKGDIAKVTADPTIDNNGVYWLNGSYAMLTDWIQIVGPGAVVSVNGKSGVVVLAPADIGAVPVARTVNGYALTGNIAITKADVGLGNAENTTDANKPISTATQTALNAKQNTLTFDDAPTSGSSNPVKSGGVFSSIATRVPTARTVNTKPLSADVILNAADVGALASNSVVDNLTTDSATAPLSAGMGRTLENGKVFYSAVMPPANANNLGKCFVAIGSPSGMTRGNIYQCTQSGSTYAWTNRSTFGSAAFRDVGVSANGVLSPTTAGTVGQSVRVASNGTALEWYTPSSSSLAVYNGSFTGNGTAKTFTLNHGLTGIPMAQVTASGEVVYPDVSVSGTSIVVTFNTAPVSGSVYEVRAIA